MDAAGRDVRRDQCGDLAPLELVQDPVALRLGLAAVQGRRADAVGEQVLGELVGGALGVHEHDHAAVPGRDLQRHVALVLVVHVEHVVLHAGDGARARVDGVRDRVVQEAADQPVHVLVERGREQQPLPVRADLLQQGRDLRQKAHVGHLVGLVQHGDRDAVEPDVAAVQQVPQAARGGDEHLDAALHLARLASDRQSADDGGEAQVDGRGVGGERGGDLLGQLAGRHQHQGQRRLGLGAAARRPGQQGEAEGERLAGAGPAAAEHVAPRECVRQRGALDRERLGDALADQRRLQRARQVHLREGRGGRKARRLRSRHLEVTLRGDHRALHGAPLRRAVGLTTAPLAAFRVRTLTTAALLARSLLRGERPAEPGSRTLVVGPVGAVVHGRPSTRSHEKALWARPSGRAHRVEVAGTGFEPATSGL